MPTADSLSSVPASLRRRLCAATLLGVLSATRVFAVPTAIDLPGKQAFPENITSAKDGTMYVGSLDGGVLRIKPRSTRARLWIKPGAYGSRSIFGVLVDERSHTLWACSNDLTALGVVVASREIGSYLKGFDLATGAGKVSVKMSGERTLCNDIAVGPDGSAYVTNTMAPEILRLAPGSPDFEVWSSDPLLAPPAGGGAGLDGIVFGTDGNLYVDTYTPGELFRVNVSNGRAGTVTKLSPSRPLQLADAIRPYGKNIFLLIEGGGRLDRMVIEGDAATIETLKDGFDLPTGVAVVGKTAWVSEGQLSSIFDPSKKGEAPKLPFHVYGVPLSVH